MSEARAYRERARAHAARRLLPGCFVACALVAGRGKCRLGCVLGCVRARMTQRRGSLHARGVDDVRRLFGRFQLGVQTRMNIPYTAFVQFRSRATLFVDNTNDRVRTHLSALFNDRMVQEQHMFPCHFVCEQHQRARTYRLVSLVQLQDGPRTAHVPVPLCMRTTPTSVYVQIGKHCSATGLVQGHSMLCFFNNRMVGVVPTVVANYSSDNCVC
jgi:hypothetical protein